jgi:hypothetical protein
VNKQHTRPGRTAKIARKQRATAEDRQPQQRWNAETKTWERT